MARDAHPKPRTPASGKGGIPLLPAVVAPLAALALYFGALNHPIDTASRDWISQSPNAELNMPASRIWLAPLPPLRPDLGIYRPLHGLMLRVQYELTEADKARLFHAVSVALFVAMCMAAALLAGHTLGRDRPLGPMAALTAAMLPAIHPMATEAVNWVWGQNYLLAGAAWTAALWVYLLAREGRLPPWLASSLIALAYFTAFGAYEGAVVLPLALLALDRLAPPPPKADSGEEDERTPLRDIGVFRLLIYGLPMAGATAALLVLRWVALDYPFGPHPDMQALSGASALGRVLAGCSAFGLGLFRLAVPWGPTFFYDVRYSPRLPWPMGLGLLAVAGFAALFVWALRRRRRLALGLALTAIPLLPLLQIVPLTEFFAERYLILSLPGLGIAVGDVVAWLHERRASSRVAARPAPALVGTLLAVGLGLAAIVFARTQAWADPAAMWEAEARRHPENPRPLALRMIEHIANPELGIDREEVRRLADKALALAEPPDADRVHQYLALMHLTRGDLEAFKQALADARKAPGPHVFGYFSLLGNMALRVGLTEDAEALLRRELERNPDNLDALVGLTELTMRDENWEEAYRLAERTAALPAPHHVLARANLRLGLSAARLERNTEAHAAYLEALRLDEGMPEAWLSLARLYVDTGQWGRAESALARARELGRFQTLAALYRIHVDALERQGKQQQVYDFLKEMTDRYVSDTPMMIWAGRYLVEHGQLRPARAAFEKVLNRNPGQPDALVGLGLVARAAGNPNEAAQFWAMALQADPNHREAQALLRQLQSNNSGLGLGGGP